jgi:hypothetical protein
MKKYITVKELVKVLQDKLAKDEISADTKLLKVNKADFIEPMEIDDICPVEGSDIRMSPTYGNHCYGVENHEKYLIVR